MTDPVQQRTPRQPPHSSILPPLEECLFGARRKCPKISRRRGVSSAAAASPSPSLGRFFEQQQHEGQHHRQHPDDQTNTLADEESTAISESNDSIMDNSRWGAVAAHHDISMSQLRKLCSQGIADEGSWRGVAWRVLLGYLPTNNIEHVWPQSVPAQRQLYDTLIRQYLYVSPHNLNGRELRGHLSKQLHKNRQLRQNYNRVGSLNDSGPITDMPEEGYESEEDLIDACIRRGSMQSFHAIKQSSNNQENIGREQQQQQQQQQNGSEHSDSEHAVLDGDDDHEDDDDDDDKSNNHDDNPSKMTHGTNYESITDQLPTRFCEEWMQAGMNSLDQPSNNSSGGGSNSSFSLASIAAINRLVVPAALAEEAQREKRRRQQQEQPQLDGEDTITGQQESIDDADADADESITGNSTASSNNPATPSLDQVFHNFLQDAQMLEQIRKDVVRTHQDLRFYLEPDQNLGVRRCAALERILYVWSKLNKGVRYVQGMNEIVGTLYYVLANDVNSDWGNMAEPDTYYLFQALLLEFQDVFMPELDDTSTGIQGRMTNLERLLHTHDPSLQAHLHDVGIDASFYALRWLSTLLSREFLLPDTIRLWDSMFSSTHKENFLRYVCGTMTMMIREDLLRSDLGGCLRLLQSYPPTNMDEILHASKALWLFESQITLAVTKGGISLSQALQTIRPPPTIIMAFGLSGGVPPPSMADVVQERAHQTAAAAAAKAEQATTGLIGRAKGIWIRWGSTGSEGSSVAHDTLPKSNSANGDAKEVDGAVETPTTASATSHPSLPTGGSTLTSAPVLKRRAWNRDRAESYGSVGSNQAGPSELSAAASFQSDSAPISTETPGTGEVPPTPPVSRFWNRGRTRSGSASLTPDPSPHMSPAVDPISSTADTDMPDLPKMPTPPSRLWKRNA